MLLGCLMTTDRMHNQISRSVVCMTEADGYSVVPDTEEFEDAWFDEISDTEVERIFVENGTGEFTDTALRVFENKASGYYEFAFDEPVLS